MVSTTYVPPDIIALVIDYLADNDINSLKQCSLVASSFLPFCRRLLFKSIKLDHSSQCRGLYRVITANLPLAGYVRVLEVIRCAEGEFRYRDWVTIEQTLTLLLQTLHSLDRFILRTDGGSLLWNVLPQDLRSAIMDISAPHVHLSSQACLQMEHFGRCRYLKHLRLTDVNTDVTQMFDLNVLGPATAFAPTSKGYLESLYLRTTPLCGQLLITTLTDSRSVLSLVRLKSLILSGSSVAADSLTEVSGSSLEHISWTDLGREEQGLFPGFTSCITSFPSLTSIVLSTTFSAGRPFDPLPAFAKFLTHPSFDRNSPHPLTHLEINISFYGAWKFSITSRDIDTVDEYPFWPALDIALAQPRVYPNLERVLIGMKVGGGGEAFKGLSERRLSRLVKMDLLKMVFLEA